MTDDLTLRAAAFKNELVASSQLARRTGMAPADALRVTLTQRAGRAGLEQLVAERTATRLRSERSALVRRAQAEAAQARSAAPAAAAWRAWFDGSARPNPGQCGIGAVLEGPGGVLITLSREAGYGNSSEAEYRALIAVLHAALEHGAGPLVVYGDSQVVIDDVNAPDSASSPILLGHRQQARALLARLPGATLRWIPRHRNSRADALSQRATPPLSFEAAHEHNTD